MTPRTNPLFILSFRQRDELAAAAVRAGWRPVAARRADALDRRVAAAGAAVVVIDARGDDATRAVDAARACGEAIVAGGRALAVLVDAGDEATLAALLAAGATHVAAPAGPDDAAFAAVLTCAGRYAERVSGGWVAEGAAPGALGWRYDPAARTLRLTPALAELLDVAGEGGAVPVLRRLAPRVREALRGALARLAVDGSAAFAHDVADGARVVQHLQADAVTGHVHALVEPLGPAPDAGAVLRDRPPRRTRSLAALARDLPAAIARSEIEVLYQPQVRIADGRVTGVEALARWRHPRLGDVGAEALLAAAARGRMDGALMEAVHARAFAAAAAWGGALADTHVSVNVTADDIAREGFAERVLAAIDAAGLARTRVTVEVTESGLIERLEVAAVQLERLRGGGCAVAIDDFGTGYSSLAYLASLPLDHLKLDRALTRFIGAEPRERAIVRAVIAMARALSLSTVAEGVETAAQRDLLAAEGCDTYQGYLCAPPLDAAALVARFG